MVEKLLELIEGENPRRPFTDEELAGRMEALKAQGKQKTAQFRELFAEKLTIQNTLTLWETYGIH